MLMHGLLEQVAYCENCGRVNSLEELVHGCLSCGQFTFRITYLKWIKDRNTGILGVADGHWEDKFGQKVGMQYRIMQGGWVR